MHSTKPTVSRPCHVDPQEPPGLAGYREAVTDGHSFVGRAGARNLHGLCAELDVRGGVGGDVGPCGEVRRSLDVISHARLGGAPDEADLETVSALGCSHSRLDERIRFPVVEEVDEGERRIRRWRVIGLVHRVDAVTARAGANLAGLEGDPVALAYYARAVCVGELP